LNITMHDIEAGQPLSGSVTRLPTKGSLYVTNATGARQLIQRAYNEFDVGANVRRQFLSRVLRVSSFWGSNPPEAGYHALGVLGRPDCRHAQSSNECQADQRWVGDQTLYPDLGTHVVLNGHVGYVRATHPANASLELEMVQYYEDAAGAGAWAPCYMSPYGPSSYPGDCMNHTSGGGLNEAHGRPATLHVPRSAILPLNAAIWCPENMGIVDRVLVGGGMFGPQYAYNFRQSDSFRGTLPYNEFIEAAVETPVYIFRVIVGMSRGVGAIVAIRARNPSVARGGDGEWVRLYEGAPRMDAYQDQVADGAYAKWVPDICRIQFKTDTIRLEVCLCVRHRGCVQRAPCLASVHRQRPAACSSTLGGAWRWRLAPLPRAHT
jgi:hypothetical protein